MRNEPPPEAFESGLDYQLSPAERRARAATRRVFRGMVKGLIQDRPLTGLRRRELVRFGKKLRLDTFEVRLIIRAVEYECGHVAPAAMADPDSAVTKEYLLDASPDGSFGRCRAWLTLCALVAATSWILWGNALGP